MDGRREQLREKMEHLLKETAEIAAELQKLDGTQSEVPHYSQIEESACETGKQLARLVQETRIREIALAQTLQSACPICGDACEIAHPRRTLESIVGRVEVMEPKAHCPRCRRDFFPSKGPTRTRRS